MARQEIVIRTAINDEKSRSKAMRAASKMDGVTSVGIVRQRNHLVVTGERVDSAELTRSLRKMFGYADIVSVRNMSTSRSEHGETSMEEASFRHHNFGQNVVPNYPTQYSYHQRSYNYIAVPVHDPDSPMCSIL